LVKATDKYLQRTQLFIGIYDRMVQNKKVEFQKFAKKHLRIAKQVAEEFRMGA
jgi:hypothetical protein